MTAFLITKTTTQDSNEHEKSPRNMTSPKEQNSFPITDLKEIEIY